MMYVLIQTDYEDDYKHRYDSGVYTNTIGAYNNISDAHLAEEKYTRKKIEDRVMDYEQYDFFTPEQEEYFYKIYDEDDDKKEYPEYKLKDDIDIDDAKEEFLRGEFVDYVSEWKIDEV